MQKAVPISLIRQNNYQDQIRTNRGTRTKPFQAEHFEFKSLVSARITSQINQWG